MHQDSDPRLDVRRTICNRIDAIRRAAPHRSPRSLYGQIEELRTYAAVHGVAPVAAIARSLSRLVAQDDRSALIDTYLDIMHEASACDRDDPAVSETFLAAVSVRLAH